MELGTPRRVLLVQINLINNFHVTINTLTFSMSKFFLRDSLVPTRAYFAKFFNGSLKPPSHTQISRDKFNQQKTGIDDQWITKDLSSSHPIIHRLTETNSISRKQVLMISGYYFQYYNLICSLLLCQPMS